MQTPPRLEKKTKLCAVWEKTGYCDKGRSCYFAHGVQDRRVAGEAKLTKDHDMAVRRELENHQSGILADSGKVNEWNRILKKLHEEGGTHSFPPTMTRTDRWAVHQLAKEYGVISSSSGEGAARYLVLSGGPLKANENQVWRQPEEKKVSPAVLRRRRKKERAKGKRFAQEGDDEISSIDEDQAVQTLKMPSDDKEKDEDILER